MEGVSTISFVIEPLSEKDRRLSLLPVLNGVRLTKLVEDFDLQKGHQPAGGFAGLVHRSFDFGLWDRYFMGEVRSRIIERVGYYLLGCICGEVNCWPFTARIVKSGELIVWEGFRQPNRPDRDYSSFGPFRFEMDQYRQTLVKLVSINSRK